MTPGLCTGLHLPAWVAWAGLIKAHQLSLPCSSFGQILVSFSKYFGSVGNVSKNQHVTMAPRLATQHLQESGDVCLSHGHIYKLRYSIVHQRQTPPDPPAAPSPWLLLQKGGEQGRDISYRGIDTQDGFFVSGRDRTQGFMNARQVFCP